VLIVSTCALLHALAPRLAPLAWLLVGWATVVGMLAQTLSLPEWARRISPLHAAGRVPIEDPNLAALLVMAALGVGAVAIGLARFRYRDLTAG
jgi:ABC-2 type transport system permease protein